MNVRYTMTTYFRFVQLLLKHILTHSGFDRIIFGIRIRDLEHKKIIISGCPSHLSMPRWLKKKIIT